MTSKWTHKVELSTDYNDEHDGAVRLTVTAGLHHIEGNKRPYFSVTAVLRKRGSGREICGGCMHDEIAAHFPALVPVIAMHLSDDDGKPMHTEANGRYHLGFGEYSKQDTEAAARHFRITVEEAEALRQDIESGSGHDPDKYEAAVNGMLPRFAAEAKLAVETLEALKRPPVAS